MDAAKVIGFTACRRPDYLARMLGALARCDGVGEYLILPHVEPGCDATRALVEGIGFAECRPTWNRSVLGAHPNTVGAIRHAFEVGEHAVFLEEDIELARDALRFHEWAAGRFRDDPGVASVTAFNRRMDAPPDRSLWHAAGRRAFFHGWGWATWRDRWRAAAGGVGTPVGWDHDLLREFVTRRGMVEVYPELSRCENFGVVTSVQTDPMLTPEWFAANHSAGHWAGLHDPGPGEFHI